MRAETRKVVVAIVVVAVVAIVVVAVVVAKSFQILFRTKEEVLLKPIFRHFWRRNRFSFVNC